MARVGLHLTDRCQLDCDHCVRDPGARPVDLPLAVVRSVLREARDLGIRHVSMTGGEPTLHPELPAILDTVVEMGMRWDVVTNGRRFDRVARWLDEVPTRREACARITFSVDGATDAIHDAIRGVGQRREVLAAMAVCVAAEIPFATSTALHARNAHELEAIAEEMGALGAISVRFAMTQPTGTPLDDQLAISPSGWRALRDRALALVPRLPVRLAEGWPRPDHDVSICGPIRGDTIHIDHHGRLTLCCAHSQAPGDSDGRTIGPHASVGLREALGRVALIREDASAAFGSAATGDVAEWEGFGCNRCLAHFGRPHWSGAGVGGASAARERWRGVWKRDPSGRAVAKKMLPMAD